jgi:branched-subunit amino acid ABC-type transport system permease component
MAASDLLLKFVLSGLMVGSIDALIALRFKSVFNAPGRSTSPRGEFVMLGGIAAAMAASPPSWRCIARA